MELPNQFVLEDLGENQLGKLGLFTKINENK